MQAKQKGFVFTLFSFILWGILPLYWRALDFAGALEILSHRIFWSFILLFLIYRKKNDPYEYVKKPRKRLVCIFTSIFITLNWGIYIYAVNAGYLVEASLGYYINPLVLIVLAMVFLKERMSLGAWAAFLMAFAGVAYMTYQYGRLPLITLALAFSFGFYALLKKAAGLDSGKSLFTEVLFLAPFSLMYLIYNEIQGQGHFLTSFPWKAMLFIIAGGLTTLPLFTYAEGVRLIPLVTVGFIQYIGPTIMLLIGVFGFGEHFDTVQMVSFSCIWTALLIYSLSNLRKSASRKEGAPA